MTGPHLVSSEYDETNGKFRLCWSDGVEQWLTAAEVEEAARNREAAERLLRSAAAASPGRRR